MESKDLLNLILTRRSIRWFKQDLVPDDLLYKILECGLRAPNAGGSEPWYFIVVRKDDVRREIHKLLLEAHRLYATSSLKEPIPKDKVDKWLRRISEGMYYAPVYIAAYADFRRMTHKEQLLDVERTFIIQSVAAAIENMLIAAHSLGIGAVWLGVPLLMRKVFDDIFRPPEGCELQAVIALGYPSETPKSRLGKGINEVVKFI